MPIHYIFERGLIFVWVTNGKYDLVMEFFKKNNIRRVDKITWIKTTI
jgi:N6-adenosine-specific RNA methylase IME4